MKNRMDCWRREKRKLFHQLVVVKKTQKGERKGGAAKGNSGGANLPVSDLQMREMQWGSALGSPMLLVGSGEGGLEGSGPICTGALAASFGKEHEWTTAKGLRQNKNYWVRGGKESVPTSSNIVS